MPDSVLSGFLFPYSFLNTCGEVAMVVRFCCMLLDHGVCYNRCVISCCVTEHQSCVVLVMGWAQHV